MKNQILTSLLYTVVTAILLGIAYPLAITGIAHLVFPARANGELVYNQAGTAIGSSLIGQSFTGPVYFHSRPSAAGAGYDAAASSGSNLGPTSKALADAVQARVATYKQPGVPVDLVTSSASGLDPDITPAAAYYQVARVAAARGVPEAELRTLVGRSITPRQLGFLGEPRVNVLRLNQALDHETSVPANQAH